MATLRFVFRTARRAAPRPLAATVALQIVTAMALPVQIFALREVIVQLESDSSSADGLTQPLALLIISSAVATLSAVLMRESNMLLRQALTQATAIAALRSVSAVDLARFEQPEFRDLVDRATDGMATKSSTVLSTSISITTRLLTILSLAVAVFVISPIVFLVTAVSAIPGLAIAYANTRALYAFNYQLTPTDRRRRALQSVVTSRRTGAELRALDAGPALIELIDDLFTDRLQRLRGVVRVRVMWGVAATLVGITLVAIAIVVLVDEVVDGRISLASGLVAFVAIQQIAQRSRALTDLAGALDQAGAHIADLRSLVSSTPALESRQPVHLPIGPIAVRDLSFVYPAGAERVLSDVNLDVDAGSFVAIVGENGAGKTTLAKVLAGLYDPGTGEIRWGDGIRSATDRRANTSFMFQDFGRFPLSLSDNITVGIDPNSVDPIKLTEAIAGAGLEQLVGHLPDGADTILAPEFQGGVELSGGEWQRIAIARTLYRDAALVIFDEPSSALDPAAETDLTERIHHHARGRTVVYITHRYPALRAADKVLVMNAGKIVEQGTHDELVKLGGLYERLFTIQASRFVR